MSDSAPAGADSGSGERLRVELTERLLDHCRQLCVTGEEGPIADAVAARYRQRDEPVERIGHSLVIGSPAGDRPVVVLVGHLDVVAPTDADEVPRVESRDGDQVVIGRGASDMKAGNVVAMELFEDTALRASSDYDVALVLYAGEEGPADDNELVDVLAAVPWLREAELAVVLEPTDGQIQVGCLGGLHATLTFRGRQAHSARPWHGDNALTGAGGLLAELDAMAPSPVDVDGVVFHDVWSATRAGTGDNPRNAIPATFVVNLNLRFAPSRDLDIAESELRAFVGDRADVEIVDRAAPARPRLDTPAVADFVAAVGAEVSAKQAWTDVARFAELGVPAVNYGPGLTAQAHQRGEYVPVAAMLDAHVRLRTFLSGGR